MKRMRPISVAGIMAAAAAIGFAAAGHIQAGSKTAVLSKLAAPAVREFNERAAELLSEDREFNEALGRVCTKLQSAARPAGRDRR